MKKVTQQGGAHEENRHHQARHDQSVKHLLRDWREVPALRRVKDPKMNTFKYRANAKSLVRSGAAKPEYTRPISHSELFTAEEAANYVRLTKSRLERFRGGRFGPLYCKLGGAVRYRRVDLDAWLKSCLQLSTSENK